MTAPAMDRRAATARAASDHSSGSATGASFQFSLPRTALVDALARVAPLASAGKLLPILQSILIEAKGGTLTMSATDMERWVRTRVPGVPAAGSGRVALPAKRLTEIVSALPQGQVVTVVITGTRAKITAGRSKFEIIGLSADEWPTPNEFTANDASIKTDGREFVAALTRVQSRVAVQGKSTGTMSNPEWQGAHLAREGGRVTLTCTDGKSVALADLGTDDASPPLGVIIPREAFAHIGRLFAGDEILTVHADDQHVRFAGATSTLTSRLIVGSFPTPLIHKLLSLPPKLSMVVDREEFVAAVSRCAIVSDFGRVDLRFPEAQIQLSGASADAGDAEDAIDATRTVHVAGAVRRIPVYAAAFTACLKAVPGERVQLDITGEKSPIYIRDAANPTSANVAMLMPLNTVDAAEPADAAADHSTGEGV